MDINAAAVSGIGAETEESVAVCGKPDEMVVLVPYQCGGRSLERPIEGNETFLLLVEPT